MALSDWICLMGMGVVAEHWILSIFDFLGSPGFLTDPRELCFLTPGICGLYTSFSGLTSRETSWQERKSMTHLALFLFLERHLLTNMVFFSLINSGSGKTSLAKSSAFPQQSDNKAFQRTSPVPVYVHRILIVVYAVFLWLINCTWIHWYFNYCSAISTLPLRRWLQPGGASSS